MTALEITVGLVAVLVGLVTLTGSLVATAGWLIRRLHKIIKDETAELRPNGGGSMKDVQKAQAAQLEVVEQKVDFALEVLGIDARALRARTDLNKSLKESQP